ncbi:TonB-dependent receptor [Sphingomonas kyungheensis]|uniref:TonB-dependent receptor n=1 Tax=Sphingomonas kyungheensis TaxID=1069987 RepID=A0ABU8H670_9SPHN
MKNSVRSVVSGPLKSLLLTTSALSVFAAIVSPAAAQTATPPIDEQASPPKTGAPDTDPATVPDDGAADPGRPNDIVVTGIRKALESAKEIKRNADTVVDSITASDIATLPDLSVAEALGRVPGVTISRFATGGASPDFPSPEGQGNLIRGLGFVRSEFNGRDAFSANGGRVLDFSSIPPELIGAVDVYKNQTADLIEGGISGTINLRTLEPFDRQKPFLAISLDNTYTDLRKKSSPSGSITAGRRWRTGIGEFGVIASYSRSNLDSRINGWQQNAPFPRVLDASGNVPQTNLTGAAKLGEFTGVDPSNIIGTTPGFQMRTNDVDRDRRSYYGAIQWKNDRLQLTAKYIRVEETTDSIEHTFEWFPEHDTGTTAGITNLKVDKGFSSAGVAMCSGAGAFPSNPGDCETLIPIQGGLMESGFVTNRIDSWTGAVGSPVGSLGIGRMDRSKTQDISLNAKWQATDRLLVTLDGQYTKASASTRQIWAGFNTYLDWQIAPNLDNPRINFSVDPEHQFNPNNTRYTGDSATNPLARPTSSADFNGSTFQFAADQFQVGKGDLYALRADTAYDLSGGEGFGGWFDSVKLGARYAKRSQTNAEMALNWGSIAPPWDGRGGYGIVGTFQDPNQAAEVVSFSNFYRGGVVQGSNQSFVFANRNLLSSYSNFRKYLNSEPQLAPPAGCALPTCAGNFGWLPRGTDDGSRFGSPTFRPEDISDITERTFNAYMRLDAKHEFDNGMSIAANAGVRYVRTELNSAGFQAFRPFVADTQTSAIDANGVRTRTDDAESRDDPRDFLPGATAYSEQAAVPITYKQTNVNWLPSFNVRWNIDRQQLVRFAYSKGLSRPNVQDLRASQEYVVTTNRINYPTITDRNDPLYGIDRGAQSITVGEIRVNRGNPRLRPTLADNFDLSIERYFRGGYVSIAGFYKSLSNIITNGDLPLGTTQLDGQTVNIIYSGQVNQAKAKIKGVEVSYQQFFDKLPGVLSHLGFQGNYTYIDSSATPPANGVDSNGDGVPDDQTTVFRFGVDNLLGQSDHILNAVGIYQDSALELRLAYNWRSKYLTSYRDYVTGNPVFNSAAGFLDASVRFKVGALTLRTSIANILDTKSKSQVQIDKSGQMFDRFSFLNDRRVVFGALLQF